MYRGPPAALSLQKATKKMQLEDIFLKDSIFFLLNMREVIFGPKESIMMLLLSGNDVSLFSSCAYRVACII